MTIEQLYELFVKHPKISTDTRSIEPNSIFFALKGEKFDANIFAKEALDKGAAYAVISDNAYAVDNRTIVVEDTLQTLQQLSNFHRKQLQDTIFFALTGSNGKTTTKELISKVVSRKYKTVATQGNLNNHIGVPLTLLSILQDTQFAVVEMGANHFGEIAELCKIAEPDSGTITNIGYAHVGTFGGFENLAKTKLGLYDAIKQRNGVFFQNTNDKTILAATNGYRNIFKYGSAENADVKCLSIESKDFLKIKIATAEDSFTINTRMIGAYNADNVLCAVAVGLYYGVELSDIIAALESYEPTNNRSQLMQTEYNKLILDMYNANPSSMEAAIINFANTNFDNKMLIIGDMLELGDYSLALHQKIVDLINTCNFDEVFVVGKTFAQCSNTDRFVKFDNIGMLCDFLKNNQIKNKTILLKASNSINLKLCVEYL